MSRVGHIQRPDMPGDRPDALVAELGDDVAEPAGNALKPAAGEQPPQPGGECRRGRRAGRPWADRDLHPEQRVRTRAVEATL